jgi:hypothetical protein
VWPGANVAPRGLSHAKQRDSVAPTAVARLTAHIPCNTWPPVTPEQVAQPSRASPVGATQAT